jgi:hypothetical protein
MGLCQTAGALTRITFSYDKFKFFEAGGNSAALTVSLVACTKSLRTRNGNANGVPDAQHVCTSAS